MQAWRNAVRHFSACRKEMDKLNGHLYEIIQKDNGEKKSRFIVRFIPDSSIFNKENTLLSAIPTSYLLDLIRELLDDEAEPPFHISHISGIKNSHPVNPFEEDEYLIEIELIESDDEVMLKEYKAEIKKDTLLLFEAHFVLEYK